MTITCINPFTSTKTTFSVFFFLYICLHKYLCHQHCRKSVQWCYTTAVINWFKNLGIKLSNSTLLNSIDLFQISIHLFRVCCRTTEMMNLLLLMVVFQMCWEKNKKEDHCFKNERLSITIANNLFETDFFDVPSSFLTGKFSPFRKPNNLPPYVNTKSNHLPTFRKSWYNN